MFFAYMSKHCTSFRTRKVFGCFLEGEGVGGESVGCSLRSGLQWNRTALKSTKNGRNRVHSISGPDNHIEQNLMPNMDACIFFCFSFQLKKIIVQNIFK